MIALYIGLSILAGCLLAYFFLRTKFAGIESSMKERLVVAENERKSLQAKVDDLLPHVGEVASLCASLEERKVELQDVRKQLDQLFSDKSELDKQLETAKGRIEERENALGIERERFLEEKKQLEDSFASLSKQALAAAQTTFMEMANEKFQDARKVSQEEIDKVLAPMRETLIQLREHTRDIEEKRTESYARLSQGLRDLMSSTNQLSNALRRPEVRGSWGELTLRRAAEAAGLVEGTDFEMQVSSDTEDGKQRPDMVVRLPNNRVIIVDSKVPLDAYLSAINEDDLSIKRTRLQEHAAQVRKHIQQLSGKAYQNLYAASADFVVMFVPSEALYQGAIQEDPSLLEEAFSKRVVLANPMTLVALLRTVANGMQQQKAYENALKIAKIGGELHDSVAVFADHYVAVGKALGNAAKRYNEGVGSLERNVMSKARRMKELGSGGIKDVEEPEILNAVIRPSSLPSGSASSTGEGATQQSMDDLVL
jgi:DNA recombination protein RmuC